MTLDGVILFADDEVFKSNPEKELYNQLRSEFPVLAVNSLEMASKAVLSIGSFAAIILDWEFKLEDPDLPKPKITRADTFLDSNDFFSLIYVFSNNPIPTSTQKKYKQKFKDRIKFERKVAQRSQQTTNFEKIKKDLNKWTEKNRKLKVAYSWSKAINRSVQSVFNDLSKTNINWIFDLHDSATNDGANSQIEVVSLLHDILKEKIIRDNELLLQIADLVNHGRRSPQDEKIRATLKLFQIIYYTKLSNSPIEQHPIMTGDVFRLNKRSGQYGLLVTPECDIRKIITDNSNFFELLTFSKDDFERYVVKSVKSNNENATLTAKEKRKAIELYNQNEIRFHFLPSFPFTQRIVDNTAVLDFSTAIVRYSYLQLMKKTRICKINSPFIHQIRQRFLSYNGRVGVPAVLKTIRESNISTV